MSPAIEKLYRKYRAQECGAANALLMAKIVAEFRERENGTDDTWTDDDPAHDVRLIVEPEYDNYFDVYGEPDGFTDGCGRRFSAEEARKEIERDLERDGLVCVVAEYFDPNDGEWTMADSIGMCNFRDPRDPLENYYVPDLMRRALQHANEAREKYDSACALVHELASLEDR